MDHEARRADTRTSRKGQGRKILGRKMGERQLTLVIETTTPAIRVRVPLPTSYSYSYSYSYYRGRDDHYWPPPAQIRTSGFPAYGSYL